MNDFSHMQRHKEKLMAYVLHTEFGYTKVSIAQLMKISPQQMGQWIKEAAYEIRINNLQTEVVGLKQELMQLGYTPMKSLDPSDF
jgi:transposase-like protein